MQHEFLNFDHSRSLTRIAAHLEAKLIIAIPKSCCKCNMIFKALRCPPSQKKYSYR